MNENYNDQYLEKKLAQFEVESGIVNIEELINQVPLDTPEHLLPDRLEVVFKALAKLNPAKVWSVLKNLVRARFNLNVEDLRRYEKTINTIRKELASVKLPIVDNTEALPTTYEDSVAAQANALLQSPSLLFDVLTMIKKLGVVGEERTSLLHFLVLTSRLLQKPVSVTVKGDSSAGKSFTISKVLKLFPKSAYIDITDATAQSFYYSKENHFKHKTIIIFEKHGGEKADYAIRTLQSEGKLKIQVTVKNPVTGEFETKEIEREGPSGFITTTTESLVHAENETRNISVFPDQSESQTVLIYAANDAQYRGVQYPTNKELEIWHCLQSQLQQMPVLIPFADSLRGYFPKSILRTRRDHAHFLAVVEVSTFIHQKQREKVEKNGKMYIRACLADYENARIIAEESLSKSIYELPPKTIELIEKAKAICDEKHWSSKEKSENSEEGYFTVTELAKVVGWDRDTVARWMRPASRKGYFTMLEESKGKKGAKYIVEEKDLPGDGFLPVVQVLAKGLTEESMNECYNPLTGEKLCTDAPTQIEETKIMHV